MSRETRHNKFMEGLAGKCDGRSEHHGRELRQALGAGIADIRARLDKLKIHPALVGRPGLPGKKYPKINA